MKNRQLKEKKFWDKFALKYDAYMKRTLDETYVSILKNMKEDLKQSDKVLEIGAGTGLITFAICSKVMSIIATDILPEMIKVAQQKKEEQKLTNIDFQVQDSYKLDFSDNSFDMVLATNVLHLLYEPEKAIREVKRVVRDNGVFIAPNFCMGETRKDRIIAKLAGLVSGFKIVNKWSIKEYKKVITTCGFQIEKTILIDGRFPLAYMVARKS